MLRFEQLEEMISEFERLPTRVPSRTLMEVAGYPHYENVCSNILAFYFDPGAEHGLNDLLLRAIMDCMGLEWTAAIKRADVGREVYSAQGGRLDILIETEEFLVGIENKIWAGLGNDLHDYRNLIASRATSKQIPLESIHYVVLSLRPLDATTMTYLCQAGFCNITYPRLIEAARNLLGRYAAQANLKFLGFFTDFMQTIENLIGPQEDTEASKFFSKYGILLEELNQKYTQYRNGKAPALLKLTEPWLDNYLSKEEFIQAIYKATNLMTHLRAKGEHSDKAISVDLDYEPGNWAINLFSRGFTNYKQTDECHSFFKNLIPALLAGLGNDWVRHKDVGLRKTYPSETTNENMALQVKFVFLTVMSVLGYQVDESAESHKG